MIQLNLTTTRTRPLPAPEPLPAIVDTPANAFLAGWWGGICVGGLIGACCMYLLLHAIGRLLP